MASALVLAAGIVAASAPLAQANEAKAAGFEDASAERDAKVAPVRRVFPKTPSDRDLTRLSKTKITKDKSAQKSAEKKSPK